jgi:hypothetical protein
MMMLVMMMLFECARRPLFSFTILRPSIAIHPSITLSFNMYSSSSPSSSSGKSFLQFSKVLNMKLEVVDPSLYIHR